MRPAFQAPGPGPFQPTFGLVGTRFSLLWVFLLITLVTLPFAWKKLRNLPTEARSLLTTSGMTAILFFVVILQTRWQPLAQLPDRFLLPAFAIGLVLFGWSLDRLKARGSIVITLLGSLLFLHGIPYLLASEKVISTALASHWQAPQNYVTASKFEEAARGVGSGKSILLFASQGAQDYPLFDAQHGFSNRVYSWGKEGFDPGKFQKMLDRRQIDAIVFEQSTPFVMLWDPPFDPAPFLRACETLPGFIRVPMQGNAIVFLKTPGP